MTVTGSHAFGSQCEGGQSFLGRKEKLSEQREGGAGLFSLLDWAVSVARRLGNNLLLDCSYEAVGWGQVCQGPLQYHGHQVPLFMFGINSRLGTSGA